jgi:ethanolamine permease
VSDKEHTSAGPNLDAVVNEVVAEGHLEPELLRPEERAFLKKHALKKPLRVLDIWALAVGVVIAGAYFGWNLGLKDNGPVAMLLASLLVCLLYLAWVLSLAELSVAMPFAGGPMGYGRRTSGPLLGFIMGWSMFLECQFAAIATALATGGYVAYLCNPDNPDPHVRVAVGLATAGLFFVIQAWGVKEQSWIMMAMTYGAIAGLVLFMVVATTHFSWPRAWPDRPLPESLGWQAVLMAVPYALWWLVMIETVALAAEEAHEPQRTIPRGLVWGQLTLIGLVVLTWLFACGAVDSQALAFTRTENVGGEPTDASVDYPLLKAISLIPAGRSALLFYGFGVIALFGLIASYHGMIFGSSRQAFALGRAGYLPAFLGLVHVVRRTPVLALLACSLLTVGFVIASYWFKEAVDVAVLVSTLTALIWYILAMVCLFILRRREPSLFDQYQTPLHRLLPITVIVLSLFSAFMYGLINVQVIPLTIALYVVGLGYFGFWGRKRLQIAAPEELTARHSKMAADPTASRGNPQTTVPATLGNRLLASVSGFVLLLLLLALAWVTIAAWQPAWGHWVALRAQIGILLALLIAALVLISCMALLHTRR